MSPLCCSSLLLILRLILFLIFLPSRWSTKEYGASVGFARRWHQGLAIGEPTSAMPGCDISTGCCWWLLEHFQMLRSLGRSRKIWEHLGGWCYTTGFRCVFDILFDILIIEKQDRYMRRSNVRMLKSASRLTCTGEGEGYVRFRLKRRLSPILQVCGMWCH